ncbi:MAG: hypothetical protein Q9M27_07185 [Mariprofundaceae bacterium]|nr:hypothetical protein [Mariprofundaceae bacterium]
MGQMTIYLDDKTEAEMKAAATAAGISKSKWVACVIHEKAGNEWPDGITRLAGAWPDLPTAEEIRHTDGDDARRETF